MAKVSQWVQFNAAVYDELGNTEYVLVKSKTEPCKDFLFPRYQEKTYPATHKEVYKNISMDCGDYAHTVHPRIDYLAQTVKPAGKVKEISIDEE